MKILNEEGKRLKDEYDLFFADITCGCAMQFTCKKCEHPGNPKNIDKNKDLWMEAPADNIQQDMMNFFGDIQEKYGIKIKNIDCDWEYNDDGGARPLKAVFSGE